MKKYGIISAVFLLLLVCTGFLLTAAGSHAKTDNNVIGKGIFIGPVALEGRNREQAEAAVQDYVERLRSRTVVIAAGKKEAESTLGELGYDMVPNDYVEEALNFGTTGNLIKRYKELKDIENENIVYEPTFTLDDQKLTDLLEAESKTFSKKSVNASLKRENGTFIIVEHKTGRKLAIQETADRIKEAVNVLSAEGDIRVDAAVTETEPRFTTDLMKRCTSVLGTYSTRYATSSNSRAANLANAARLLNGSVIYPGEVFSAGRAMSPISAANGYYMAGSYNQGQVVDSIGGGVCQVSTTLYNALLKAELEIEERQNHSMIVSYVKLAMDAAIAGEGNGKDLKFKNNTKVPIYMEVYTVGREITFTLYGEETRDTENRRVEYVSETTEVIQPGPDKITEDKNQPVTYEKVDQPAHIGYRAKLWKVIYVNGKQVSKELVNSSYYAAVPRFVTKGTKEEPSPSPSPSTTPKPVKTPRPTKTPVKPTPEPIPVPTLTPEPVPTPEPIPTMEPEETPEADIEIPFE